MVQKANVFLYIYFIANYEFFSPHFIRHPLMNFCYFCMDYVGSHFRYQIFLSLNDVFFFVGNWKSYLYCLVTFFIFLNVLLHDLWVDLCLEFSCLLSHKPYHNYSHTISALWQSLWNSFWFFSNLTQFHFKSSIIQRTFLGPIC